MKPNRMEVATKLTLGNGMRLIWTDQPYAHVTRISAFIPAGPVYESPEMSGISHFLEHLHLGRMHEYSCQPDFQRASHCQYGILDGATSKTFMELSVVTLPDHLSTDAKVFRTILDVPEYSRDSIERERRLIVDELKSGGDVQSTECDILEFLNTQHPLGRPVVGTRETVERISRSDLLLHDALYFDPARIVVVLTGRVDESAVNCVSSVLDEMPAGSDVPLQPATYPSVSLPRIGHCGHSGERLFVGMGWYIDQCLSLRDRVALKLIETSTKCTNLWIDTRYSASHVYRWRADLDSRGGVHCLYIQGITSRGERDCFVERVLHEFRTLRQGKVDATWIRRVRARLLCSLEAMRGDPAWLARRSAIPEVECGWDPPQATLEDELRLIERTSAEAVIRCAQRYLTRDRFFIYFGRNRLFGDIARIRQLAEKSFRD